MDNENIKFLKNGITMIVESNTPFQKAVDAVETLDMDDREELL